MRFSADLHPETRSRPVYAPLTPDLTARLHLVVTDSEDLPADLTARFVGLPFELWTRPLTDLSNRLATETTGLRLCVVGAGGFLWEVVRIAEAAGLGESEIMLQPRGLVPRRVQCVHCKALLEANTESSVACPGCGLRLLVRNHFSRRLGAYQGVALHGATRGEIT